MCCLFTFLLTFVLSVYLSAHFCAIRLPFCSPLSYPFTFLLTFVLSVYLSAHLCAIRLPFCSLLCCLFTFLPTFVLFVYLSAHLSAIRLPFCSPSSSGGAKSSLGSVRVWCTHWTLYEGSRPFFSGAHSPIPTPTQSTFALPHLNTMPQQSFTWLLFCFVFWVLFLNFGLITFFLRNSIISTVVVVECWTPFLWEA